MNTQNNKNNSTAQLNKMEKNSSIKYWWKTIFWKLFKLLYTLLGTFAILFIIYFFWSNYYYNMGYYSWQQQTERWVINSLVNSSKTCKVITVWNKKSKNLTKLINIECLRKPNNKTVQNSSIWK